MEPSSDLLIATIIVSAVALAAIVALVVTLVRSSHERDGIIRDYEDEKDELQERLMEVTREKSALQSTLAAREEYEKKLEESHREALAVQREIHDKEISEQGERHRKDLENLKDAFKALSAENSAQFRTQSAESISLLLKPIQEKFSQFDQAVRESQKESAAQSAALKENIDIVMKHSQAVGEEARNLADALTGYSKVQGDFGEMLLTDVLKNAGLVEGIHFFTQGVMTDSEGREIKSEEGRTMIPDVMVWYPDDTTVIVDSKVSLKAFKEYVISETVEDRKRWAKAHVESIRRHVDELKAKDYASYLPEGRRKVKDNIMFIPVEGAFRLMLEEDPMLWQVAKDNNVLIVSQMTLIIVLNMIQMAWKQADQEKNISDVYRTAEELMSQLEGWMGSFVSLGDTLEKASLAYSETKRKLKDSNQSVMKKIEKLEKLGISPKKSKGRIRTTSRSAVQGSVIPKELAADCAESEGAES